MKVGSVNVVIDKDTYMVSKDIHEKMIELGIADHLEIVETRENGLLILKNKFRDVNATVDITLHFPDTPMNAETIPHTVSKAIAGAIDSLIGKGKPVTADGLRCPDCGAYEVYKPYSDPEDVSKWVWGIKPYRVDDASHCLNCDGWFVD